jgi:hypothetical protein
MDEIKNPKDGLEIITRKAAENAHFDFNPAAWAAMEQKLDSPVQKPFNWWKIIGPGVLLVILSLTNFWPIEEAMQKTYITTEKLPLNEEAQKNARDQTVEILKNKKGPQQPEQKQTLTGNFQTDSQEELIKPDLIISKDSSDLKSNASINYFVASEDRSKKSISEDDFLAATRSDTESFDKASQETGLVENSIAKILIEWVPRAHPLLLDLKPLDINIIPMVSDDSLQQFKRWTYGVMVSLDFSATGLDGFTKPGTMVGAFAEYRFAKTLSVLLGLSYAIKNYSALGIEYETPYWIAARPDDLLSIDAKCFVVDIPINIKKYFKTKNGKDWFVSTGVSSYLMLREDYTYNYTEQKPNWLESWSIKNQNSHYLGILNLSAGFETAISKKLAFSIEPFFKLPLTGIGEGNVKFLSFGANLALKWR